MKNIEYMRGLAKATIVYNGEVNGWMLPGETFTPIKREAENACKNLLDHMLGNVPERMKVRFVGIEGGH